MGASLTRRRSPVPDGAGRGGERRRGRVQAQEAPMPTRRRAVTPALLAANLVSGPALLLTMGRLARTPSPGPALRDHPLPQGGEGCIFWSTLSFFSYSPLGPRGDPRSPPRGRGLYILVNTLLFLVLPPRSLRRPTLAPASRGRGASAFAHCSRAESRRGRRALRSVG
jgi:hypothetical protein